ncbi:MAG: CinA family protein [Parvularcula sp.]
MNDPLVHRFATAIVTRATAKNLTIATAESCTGGLISAALTDVAGASAVFTHGFVTYANAAKRDLLGVSEHDIACFGAVSPEVAAQMASGAARVASAQRSVAVTGIAGPGGGSAEKPVGLVYIGLFDGRTARVHRHLFPKGSRSFIRLLTVREALRHMLASI